MSLNNEVFLMRVHDELCNTVEEVAIVAVSVVAISSIS